MQQSVGRIHYSNKLKVNCLCVRHPDPISGEVAGEVDVGGSND